VHSRLVLVVLAAVLLLGCTAGEDDEPAATSAPEGSVAVPSGPAPGLTDDTVRIGVTFPDLEALGDIVNLDHGDYELAYQAQFDAINEAGGINGRTIEPFFAAVNPVGTDSAEAACVELTEDHDVFLVTGFFIEDTMLCELQQHETAVVGGQMTPERLSRAAAPWFTWETSTDLQNEALRAMAEDGDLDGTVGVFARPAEQAQMEDDVLPLLDELGVDVAESAVLATTGTDINAGNADTQVIAERFQAADVDTVVVLGTAGLLWATGTESLDYRPRMLIPDANAVLAYAKDAGGRDLSVLDGAVAGNLYGGPENTYELPAMAECIGTIEDAGGEVMDPADAGPDDGETWVSAFNSCNNVAIIATMVEAAGDDLNYGSLAAAADGLEVELPGEPEPITYGPPPSADGDRPAHLYDWDGTDFVIRE
jgi:hypothetical protein